VEVTYQKRNYTRNTAAGIVQNKLLTLYLARTVGCSENILTTANTNSHSTKFHKKKNIVSIADQFCYDYKSAVSDLSSAVSSLEYLTFDIEGAIDELDDEIRDKEEANKGTKQLEKMRDKLEAIKEQVERAYESANSTVNYDIPSALDF